MNGIGQYIESLIKKSGHSQSDIARAIGVHRQSLSYVVAGRRELSMSLALKLESFFNLAEGELLKMQAVENVRDYKRELKSKLVGRLLEVDKYFQKEIDERNNLSVFKRIFIDQFEFAVTTYF